jgi:cyanosortase A-associated protein
MNERNWRSLRLLLLSIAFTGTIVVLGRTLIAPKTENAAIAAASLPDRVSLEGWQQVSSRPLPAGTDLGVGQQFEYRQGNTPLNIETRMMVGDGNVSRFLFVYTPIRAANANLKIKYQPGVGFYGIVPHGGKLYLSACTNPRGDSTVTEQQFMQNRYTYDFQPRRILTWILGQGSLMDQRCLWTLMSVPLSPGSSPSGNLPDTNKNAASLESAWLEWHRWWHTHFPPV